MCVSVCVCVCARARMCYKMNIGGKGIVWTEERWRSKNKFRFTIQIGIH